MFEEEITMTQQERERLLNYLVAEYKHPFSGWDFSYLHGRMVEDASLPWNYEKTVQMLMSQAHALLDIGTGGGELLASLRPFPVDTCAIESYAPNVPVARQRLEPLGVQVYELHDEKDPLPFEDNRFDLIINRHEYYAPLEVRRVLKVGAHFITQQVGGKNGVDLIKLLGAQEDLDMPYWNLAYTVKELETAGIQILEQHEAFPSTRFYDVGAIVYYLKAIPWEVYDFSVEKYFEQLAQVHQMIQKDGWVEVRQQRFFIVAHKP